jgi:catechol-2,3-dioxygenase
LEDVAREVRTRPGALIVPASAAACVSAVRSVELDVTNLARSTEFYVNAWALEVVADTPDGRYFRAAGPEHHILVLREAAKAGLHAVEVAALTRSDVDRLFARASAASTVLEKPRNLTTPGGGYGFALRDAFGRTWNATAEVTPQVAWTHSPDRPFKISHVVLNSPDAEADTAFAIEQLGFRLRDQTKSMNFLGCNADHHSLAFARGDDVGLNHVAYDVDSIDAVMRGAGRLKRNGYPLQWGVGRHGPGANVFSYYLDPDEFPIEYTAEILQVDHAYKPGSPADWERPAPFWDSWGIAEPPTQRFREASAGHRS